MHTLTPLAQEKEVLLDKLFYRTLDYVLILPEGFEEDLFAGEKKNLYETVQIPGVYSSAFIDEQIDSYLKTLRLCLAGGFTPKDALSHTAAELAASSNQVQLLKPEDDTQDFKNALKTCIRFPPYHQTAQNGKTCGNKQ